jgi:poly(A) polymerase
MLKKIARMLFGKPAKASDTSSGHDRAKTATHKPSKSNSEHDTTENLRLRTAPARHRAPTQQRSKAGGAANRFGELAQLDLSNATIVPREAHNISRKEISPGALKVLYKLNDSGFQAFLVGGGVRDLLLGGHPKDFDISTDATPEQVKDLFRSARVVGRRFKIAHVRFGREIIEVTTFRAHHEIETEVDEGESRRHIRDLDSAHSSAGMILRDNVYGSINEDAMRRDFTVNALYYTTNGFHLLDFVDGLKDIEHRLIRMIGDPVTRYREDPVRILRAIRLAAKLNFRIEAATEAPLPKLAHLLEAISPARLFDETVKLFTNGEAQATFELLRKYGVADYLFKPVLGYLDDPESIDSKLIQFALHNTDQRLAEGKSVTPAFLYAALLWPDLRHALLDETGNRPPPMPLIQQEASEAISRQLRYTAIPKRFTAMMREIWELQWRLAPRSARQIESVVAHPRFRAAYDFLLLREAAGEDLGGIGDWWTKFQLGDRSDQERMIAELQPVRSPRKGRRKTRSTRESAD